MKSFITNSTGTLVTASYITAAQHVFRTINRPKSESSGSELSDQYTIIIIIIISCLQRVETQRKLDCRAAIAAEENGSGQKQCVPSRKRTNADKNEESAEAGRAKWLSISGPLSIPLTRSIKHSGWDDRWEKKRTCCSKMSTRRLLASYFSFVMLCTALPHSVHITFTVNENGFGKMKTRASYLSSVFGIFKLNWRRAALFLAYFLARVKFTHVKLFVLCHNGNHPLITNRKRRAVHLFLCFVATLGIRAKAKCTTAPCCCIKPTVSAAFSPLSLCSSPSLCARSVLIHNGAVLVHSFGVRQQNNYEIETDISPI